MSSCLFSLNFCNPSKTAGQRVRLEPGARTDRCAAQHGADLNRSMVSGWQVGRYDLRASGIEIMDEPDFNSRGAVCLSLFMSDNV